MKKILTYNICLRGLLLLVFSFVLCGKAMAYDVSGSFNASSLPDNADVVLTGNTNLYMDANKTLGRIKGDYDLTVSGGNILTINNKKSDGILVGKFTSSASMIISCGTNCAAIYASGDVNLSGNNVKLTGTKYGIYSTKTVSISCKSLTISGAWGINAEQDVNILQGTTIIDAYGVGILASTITLSADVTAKGVGYGISARKNVIINSGKIVANCKKDGSAIESSGYIEINGGSVTSSGAKYGVHSSKGAILINGDLTAHGAWAIQAYSDVNINGGKINADAYVTGIVSEAGVITISTDVDVINGIMANKNVVINSGNINSNCDRPNGSGIMSQTGDVIIKGGNVNAQGTYCGIHSKDGAISIAAPVTAKATGWAILSNNISISPNYNILYPPNGKISGSTIIDANGNIATYVTIAMPQISGQVSLTSMAEPSEALGFTLSGAVAKANVSPQWQISESGTVWSNISGATGSTFTPTAGDLGKYIRVMMTAEGMTGYLYSDSRKVEKRANTEKVVQMTLGSDGDQVYVAYAVPSQEYFILSYKKDVANLTASDWAKGVSPTSSGRFVMGGTKGCTNYVYTRKKETDFTLPGNNVASDQIYLGDPTTVLQGIRMNVALMEKEGNETFFSPIDKEDLGAYYVKYGDVLRIKVSPLPETATFNGINASRWITKIVDGYPCGGFFANYQCTQELEDGQSYKEVYYKAWKHMNYNEVIAEITSGGPNSVYIDKFYLHVANEDGVIIMDSYRTEDVTIGVGEKRTGIQVNTRPLKATLSSAYAFVSNSISSEGKEPKVTFDNETRTMTVDATEADPGTYYYNVYQCGNTMSNKIRVDVMTPPVESVQILGDDNILAERGATIQMDMLVTPVNAVAGVVIWSVDDESIATITNEGVLTIKDDAPRGIPTKVMVLVDGIYMDECEVMVPLLTPTLWYDEVNFEAFVGKPFTAPTLNNPQGLTIKYSSSDDAVAKVDNTTGAVTPVGAGQAFIYADFKGNADYEPGDACYLITVYTKGDTNGDWTVDDDDITAISDYIKTGEAAGINLDAADMNGDNKVDATDLVLLIKEIK